MLPPSGLACPHCGTPVVVALVATGPADPRARFLAAQAAKGLPATVVSGDPNPPAITVTGRKVAVPVAPAVQPEVKPAVKRVVQPAAPARPPKDCPGPVTRTLALARVDRTRLSSAEAQRRLAAVPVATGPAGGVPPRIIAQRLQLTSTIVRQWLDDAFARGLIRRVSVGRGQQIPRWVYWRAP